MLNNSEYQNFMSRFLKLIPMEETEISDGDISYRGTKSSVNIPNDIIATMESLLEKLTDLNKKSRALETTADRAETDRARDAVAAFILNRVLKSSSWLLEAERAAGKKLYNTITPYKGVGRLPANQETEVLKGMLLDLRKAEFSEAVTTLGLTTYLDELERLNTLFESLVSKESATRSADSVNDDSKALRLQFDELYADSVILANATQVLAPTTASKTFVRDVNSLIDEVRIAYNRRRGITTESSSGNKGWSGTDSGSSTGSDSGTDSGSSSADGGSSAEDRPIVE